MKRLVFVLVILVLIAAATAYMSVNIAYHGFREPVILDFPRGTSTQAMAAQLAQSGILRYSWQFLLVRMIHPGQRLQAGEYRFAAADSPSNILNRIARGDVFFYELIVPEGSNMFDIAASLGQFDFLSATGFLRAARDPSLIRDLAPQARTLEGYLFPATYRITRATTVQQLCAMMTGQFRRQWHEVQDPLHPAPVHETVTLASLVEKETGLPDERPIVASVYDNRLRKGMALDCDPTTIYAALLDERYRGVIHRSDLASNSAYNTYQHAGLPPGPIANPGVASLKAALAPAATDYLYFVAKADGSGGHHFSETMAQHNLAVQQYRRAMKASEPPSPPPPAHRSSKHHRLRKV